ncbi:MAG: MASE3 domain-containing protein [Treponemataceae bacterium]
MTVDYRRANGISGADHTSRSLDPGWIGLTAALIVIAALRLFSYLLFHTFAELFSVVIAATYAVIAWHSRDGSEGSPIRALGIAYFFVAILDTVHTLAYDGMGIFVGYAYPANQVWVVARGLESAALCFFSLLDMSKPRRVLAVVVLYSAATIGGLAAIFVFRVFPACFVAGSGQTPFKVGAEIFIISLLVLALLILRSRRAAYSSSVYKALWLSIATTVFSELSFMVYVSNFDLLNLFGHLLKIVSFYLVYRAVVVTCLEKPQEILFDKLRKTMDELRDSNVAKDSFISILSHDLRGPLSGIRSLSESYLDSKEGEGGFTDRAAMAEISKAADVSLRLVERVLDWARARSGDLSPHPREVDAVAIVGAEIEALSKFAGAKGVRLLFLGPENAVVNTDEDMLGVIVRNLLQNAIKFTPSGGTADISVRLDAEGVSIEVSDTGVGMPPDILSHLFDPNTRVRTRGTDGEKGSGFGLVLCAEFTAKLGGKLTVESELGKGSVFRLALPPRL